MLAAFGVKLLVLSLAALGVQALEEVGVGGADVSKSISLSFRIDGQPDWYRDVVVDGEGEPLYNRFVTSCSSIMADDIGDCVMHCFELVELKYGTDDPALQPEEALVLGALQRPDTVKEGSPSKIHSDAYLNLAVGAITGKLYPEDTLRNGYEQSKSNDYQRDNGVDWPTLGYTMVGTHRTQLLRTVLEVVISEGIPGDFLEAGVWRGGQSVFAKALLDWYGEGSQRTVFVCDSFEGLPLPSNPEQDSAVWSEMDYLRVGLPQVRDAFDRMGVSQENVQFVKGFFRHSMPELRKVWPGVVFSILRLDGDMFESYFDCLFNLYDALSINGFVLVDDYVVVDGRRAVTEFRRIHGITDTLYLTKDGMGAYWRKSKEVQLDMGHYFEVMKLESSS